MTKVVAITGRRGAGKSWTAAHLLEELPRHCAIWPLASPLKAGLAAMFPGVEVYGPGKDAHNSLLGTTPRRAMQTLGTEWARETFGEDIWLRVWKRRYDRLEGVYALLIVDDVRFANEVAFFEELGALMVHCEGGEAPSEHSSDELVIPENALRLEWGSVENRVQKIMEAMR